MYEGGSTQDGATKDFPVTIGLHQGSTLNDVVLLDESRDELNGRLEIWRQALEAYGFHMKADRVLLLKRCSELVAADKTERKGEERHKQFIQVPSTNRKSDMSPLHFQGEFNM
ncbi:hypothetical protein MTR_0045s0160 [Medicago truncatula]|uniref:Uncharacterized protein n=1 Tax=Medicago truncatula TaxID=3880 RepID=A0A072TJM0_MEDTR|nr:hypothetical protein MTR_0045s0160 [Medicago truncatula]